MNEAHAGSAGFEHFDDIVVKASAETSGAEADTVCRTVDHVEQDFDILLRAENARKPENGTRRIIRMNHHDAAGLLRDRHDFGEEVFEVRLEVFTGNGAVAGKHGADVFKRHAFESGEVVDDAARERVALFGSHGIVILFRLFDHFGSVIVLRAFALENENFKRGEFLLIEEKRFGTVG